MGNIITEQEYHWLIVNTVESYAYSFGLSVFLGLIVFTCCNSKLNFLLTMEFLGLFYCIFMVIQSFYNTKAIQDLEDWDINDLIETINWNRDVSAISGAMAYICIYLLNWSFAWRYFVTSYNTMIQNSEVQIVH